MQANLVGQLGLFMSIIVLKNVFFLKRAASINIFDNTSNWDQGHNNTGKSYKDP